MLILLLLFFFSTHWISIAQFTVLHTYILNNLHKYILTVKTSVVGSWLGHVSDSGTWFCVPMSWWWVSEDRIIDKLLSRFFVYILNFSYYNIILSSKFCHRSSICLWQINTLINNTQTFVIMFYNYCVYFIWNVDSKYMN